MLVGFFGEDCDVRSLTAADQRAFTQKRLAVLLVLLVLLPFVVLCFYSHPAADDYADAVQRRKLGFWPMQCDLYFHLTGRVFTSVILTEASPGSEIQIDIRAKPQLVEWGSHFVADLTDRLQ